MNTSPKIDDYTSNSEIIRLGKRGELSKDRISRIEALRNSTDTLQIVDGILEGRGLSSLKKNTLQTISTILYTSLELRDGGIANGDRYFSRTKGSIIQGTLEQLEKLRYIVEGETSV